MNQLSTDRLNPHVMAAPASKREVIKTAMKGKDDLANLASGNPELPMPPSVVQRTQAYLQEGYARYTDYYGLDALRDGIADKMISDWGVAVHPRDELVVTNGVQEGLYVVMQTLLQPGDEGVSWEDYPSARWGLAYRGAVRVQAEPVEGGATCRARGLGARCIRLLLGLWMVFKDPGPWSSLV